MAGDPFATNLRVDDVDRSLEREPTRPRSSWPVEGSARDLTQDASRFEAAQ